MENWNASLQFHKDLQIVLFEGEVPLAEMHAALWSEGHDLLSGEPESVNFTGPEQLRTSLGSALCRIASGVFQSPAGMNIQLTITVEEYPRWPDAFILQWQVSNLGGEPVSFDRYSCPGLRLGSWITDDNRGERPWSLQGAAVHWGQDFAFPLPQPYERDNFLGHLQNAEGGGIPLVYFWNARQGVALAHVEPQPKNWYMPVKVNTQGISAALESRQRFSLMPGETLQGLRTLVSWHHGDFFAPLSLYSSILSAQGLHPAQPNAEDFEPAWCSWGYEFDVQPAEMTGVIPILEDLGIRWLTLDDRWFDGYGDWNPRTDTFPGGGRQMRQMVDKIHQAGAHTQIWWYPLAVEDGVGRWESHHYRMADILHLHPDWIILNADSSVARNNRGLAILDPALPEVQAYIADLTRRFVQEWDFDGHKLDNIYTVPACYNLAHHHQRPAESSEALAQVYKIIFETTRALKSYSVTQICPCGTPPTFSLLPYMDQAVTADPTSSAQIRQRIKFYKALLGPRAAVFADHVELSDGADDFASEIGAGGVPATKFVWPEDPLVGARLKEWWGLTPEAQVLWKRWMEVYRSHHLADGEYLNLYDLAYDKPETHVIRKEQKLYFAFYAEHHDQEYQGKVSLYGLEPTAYRLHDYVHDVWLGEVRGPQAVLEVRFQSSLLLEAIPTAK